MQKIIQLCKEEKKRHLLWGATLKLFDTKDVERTASISSAPHFLWAATANCSQEALSELQSVWPMELSYHGYGKCFGRYGTVNINNIGSNLCFLESKQLDKIISMKSQSNLIGLTMKQKYM